MFRPILSWLGLVLLAASFVWFVFFAPPLQPIVTKAPTARGKEAAPVVVLDPGHGGQDSGAMCGAVMEKDLTLDVALRAEILLRAAGYTTMLTRASEFCFRQHSFQRRRTRDGFGRGDVFRRAAKHERADFRVVVLPAA